LRNALYTYGGAGASRNREQKLSGRSLEGQTDGRTDRRIA